MSYIIDGIRTPIAKVNGHFKYIIPEILAANCIKEIIQRNALSENQIHDIILANAFGTGGNIVRNASLRAFENNNIACTTIDAQCSGGLRAIEIASELVKNNDYALAGGLESCSLAPQKYYANFDPRHSDYAYTKAEFSPEGGESNDLFKAAENTAHKYEISKAAMQDWMYISQQRAKAAKNRYSKYIINVENQSQDQLLKPNLTLADWEKLATENLIDRTTASRAADAAAVLLLSNHPKNAIAQIVYSLTIGFEPDFSPEGPIIITDAFIEKYGIRLQDIDVFEIGDSFAVNALAFAKYYQIPLEKINLSGGTLVYGHPYGATGAICMINLISNLTLGQKGLVVVPGAGGQTTAILIQKC